MENVHCEMPFALESRVKTDEIIAAFGSMDAQRNYFLYIYINIF